VKEVRKVIEKLFATHQKNRSLKVLLVEEKPEQELMYRKLFSGICKILVVNNAKEAKSILARESTDVAVLISEVNVPEECGIELLQEVREKYPQIIRVLLSAQVDFDSGFALSAINDCAVHKYLIKTNGVKDLRLEIKGALEMYISNSCGSNRKKVAGLFEEFKEACDKWTLHNVELCQEPRSLDYGLCGILSVFLNKLTAVPAMSDQEELRMQMEDYVDNIMCSSMLFTQMDVDGQQFLGRSNKYIH